ncbi:hypothetical protein RhiirA5_345883 [Rhizophagus irregularis]|uniref:Uncharacterized protein n=2 Tax=Rhizophagus irregularis TaxID=588596 RepID=A0A2I1DSG7_9GLOM|nr:hypothetical protein RirG_094010 [Rhizophagus irregularis DAOM 197198w]PKC17698.1 hypothetical protein RhiirA5_345883 [Rhizophagus irregularis]GBC53774.1 hypothetical protein PHYBLDRAFT_158554 [Rhizophagus irregularis DAOM 181602=DAOM 197198]PKC75596.1 hypothetical protein RhiirA1_407557 [Rhizophagus irregularis]PKK69062.1 hypothetical protein RhiirC2_749068 [Rhizophagus irregularis]
MTSPDENFLSLSKLDNHIASFTANLEDGGLLDSTKGISQQEATATYKLLQNVSLLLVKQKEQNNSKKNVNGASEEMEEEKKQKEEDNSLDTFNRVTVSFKDCNYVFTVSDDKIYGIKRANEVNKSSDSI